MLDKSETVDVEKVKRLETGDHGVLFYRTCTHKQRVLFSFLDAGMNRDEGAVYVAGEESPETIYKAMLNFGFDVKGLEREGRLKIVNYDGWYMVDGKVEIPKIMALWKKAYEEALATGLKGLHVCGEMDCFFRHNFVEELIEYEKNCGRRLQIPITALCAYRLSSLRLLEVNFFLDLVKSHSHVFSPSFAGSFDFEHFYQLVLPEELRETVGEMKAKAILSFLKRWGAILEAEIGDEHEDIHTALKSFVGSRADRLEKQIQLRLYKKLGVELPYSKITSTSNLF